MARGNEIIVTADPKGQFDEMIVKSGQTFYPGMIVIKDFSVALVGGRHTAKIYDSGTDGLMPAGAFWVVTNLIAALFGKLVSDSIAAGERFMGYSPRAGEELNLLLIDVTGTGDDHTVGEKLVVDDASSKLIAFTGTPNTVVAALKETVTDPTADTLAWCEWTGY